MGGGVNLKRMQLSFQKIATVPESGLVAGRIYFETSTGMIKVATSATAVDKFGDGVKSASWDEEAKTLKIVNESGEEISLNLSDVASASAVTTELAKKLSLGSSGDAAGTQSYYGLKKDISAAQTAATNAAKTYTDGEIAKIPAAIVYKADGTTITQSGDSTVTFTVGTIAQNKVTGLESALASKASTTDLNAVKATAEAAAPQATTYTKTEVDNKVSAAVGSVYKMKGSVDDATALQALTGVAIGDTYNVIAAGSLNEEPFEAGSNFVAIKAGAGNQEGMWDKLGGIIDLSAYARSADVANTYATKTAVTSEIAAKIGTLDKADTAVEGQVVSAVSETDGIITVSRRALVETDIPTIGMTKISGLSTALSGKVGTSTTVNGKALSQNITLAGEDILVGGTGTYKDDDLQAAIEAMDSRITSAAAAGVQSFEGKTGAITLKATASTNGSVNLTMSNNELQAAIVGLGSAAYTASTAYATAAQGAKADSALQKANIVSGSANGTISVSGTDVAVKGLGSAAYVATSAFDAAGSANSALTSAKSYADGLMTWAEFK